VDKGYYEYAKYGSIGVAWAVSTALYLYLGYAGGTWLDEKWGTTPVFLIAGLLLALTLSLQSLAATVRALAKEMSRKTAGKSERHYQEGKESTPSLEAPSTKDPG
jgi:ATP synthase protein I